MKNPDDQRSTSKQAAERYYERYRNLLLKVMNANHALCMDNEEERSKLTDAIINQLKETPP